MPLGLGSFQPQEPPEEEPSPEIAEEAKPEPGSTCPTCERRLPHTKKPTSPKSKVKSFRIPEDVTADYDELLEAAVVHSGLDGKPFAQFHVLNAGLVLVLQAEKGLLSRDEGAA